jgi:hypothetical protein
MIDFPKLKVVTDPVVERRVETFGLLDTLVRLLPEEYTVLRLVTIPVISPVLSLVGRLVPEKTTAEVNGGGVTDDFPWKMRVLERSGQISLTTILGTART